jgi:diguanylate cyclase (GGDEF)-like protein
MPFHRLLVTHLTGFSLPLSRAARPRRRGGPSAAPAPTRRRFILLGLALILAIVGGHWLLIDKERASSIEDFRIAMINLANGMAAQTIRPLAAVDAALRTVQRALANGDTAAGGTAASLRDGALSELLTARLAGLTGADLLAVIDAQGRLANSSPAWLALGTDLSGADYFRHFSASAPGGDAALYAGPPMRDPATGEWHSVLARRIDDRRGGFAGVVLARISLTGLEDFYRTAMPPHRTVTVTLRDGTMLVRFPAWHDAIGRRGQPDAAWQAAVAAGGGSYIAAERFDHVPVVAVVRPLPGLPWVLEASDTEADVLAGWRSQRDWLIASAIASSLIMAALLRLFALQVGRLAATNAQLDEAHKQLDLAISNMSQGLSLYDKDRRLILCNRRYGEIYRLPPAAMQPGVTLSEVIAYSRAAGCSPVPEHGDYLMSRLALLRSGQPNRSVIELTDGRTIAIQQQPMPGGGALATHEDITERRRADDRIAFLAQHDALTGLPNRSLLLLRIGEARTRAARGIRFAILLLDLDRFKEVNDTLGHGAGDELLSAVAARLLATVREDDTVARLGGDEFVILQANMQSVEECATLADRIVKAIGVPYTIGANEVVIGASIGIDIAADGTVSPDDLLKNADMAMYISKREGGGTFRFFQPEMDAAVQNRQALARDLRGAMAHDEFELYYQPIITTRSGRISGFEALLRWNHPSRGFVEPDDFIVAAEECGVIIPLGEWVIERTCREAARWPDDLHVSVNLSAEQFRAANLVEMVRDQLSATGLAPGRLRLEITETVLLHSTARNVAVLHQLRSLGVGILMDDFGVGYSSLSYLRQFPFDGVKIDRSFVTDLATRANAVYLVRAIVGLCRDLGIRSIAEGVETAAQLAILRAEGCSELQGYLFSGPRPAAHLATMMGSAGADWRSRGIEADPRSI